MGGGGFVIDHSYNKTPWTKNDDDLANSSSNLDPKVRITFIKPNICPKQLFHHVMGHCSSTDMLNNNLHLGVIWKAAILLFEAEVGRMEM